MIQRMINFDTSRKKLIKFEKSFVRSTWTKVMTIFCQKTVRVGLVRVGFPHPPPPSQNAETVPFLSPALIKTN